MLAIGMDENGLGPILGPMTVTAVAARVTDAGRKLVAKGALKDRLGDSKELVSHGDVALAEAWSRALVRRLGGDASSPDALAHAISLDHGAELRSPCPSHVERQCWHAEGETFLASDGDVARAEKDLGWLEKKGVEILGVQSVILCTRRMNDEAARGVHRFFLDLRAMERLFLHYVELHGEATATCGKVGGLMRYESAFGPLGGRLFVCLGEDPSESRYRFPGLGEMAFVRDAEEQDLLVALASLVGKWLREALMARIPRFYEGLRAGKGKELESVSGYHDPRTRAFIKATKRLRMAHRVPDDCFERKKAEVLTK